MTVAQQELSAKKKLVQSLLRCPHTDLTQTVPVFSEALEQDPLFAGKCFYALTLDEFNRIRDLEEAGIAFLLTSQYPEHRTAGRCLFQDLEPYRASRASRFVRRDLKPNRQAKAAVLSYLRAIESDKKRFDGAVRVARKQLHQMYESYHVKPSQRAQSIIFDRKIPEGDVDVVKLLRDAKGPEEQARLIVEHRIPYRLATSTLKAMTPAIWVALIEVMSPTEAVNARASVEKSGILGDDRIRKLYESKIEAAAGVAKISVSHLSERKSARGTDKGVEEKIQKVRQEKIDKSARIKMDTLVAVDCSGSMETAIEVAKRVCPQIAAICDAGLAVYCFNDTAWPIKFSGATLQDFEGAFRMIKAGGPTAAGLSVEKAIRDGFVPEQVVIVTDQGENRPPFVHEVYKKSMDDGIDIKFIIITLPGFDRTDRMHAGLDRAGADVVNFDLDTNVQTSAWYAELENVIPLLTKGGYVELVEKIMALELPS